MYNLDFCWVGGESRISDLWRGKQRDGERGRTLDEILSEAAFCFFFFSLHVLDANHALPYIGKVVIMRTHVYARPREQN